jgi:hypothetical protein
MDRGSYIEADVNGSFALEEVMYVHSYPVFVVTPNGVS